MKAFLMHRGEDFDLELPLPPNEDALAQDLELPTLFNAMSVGDKFLVEVAKRDVLSSLADPDAILYRQHVLADCLGQPAIVRYIYGLAVEAIQAERRIWGVWMGSADSVLNRGVQVLELFVPFLKKLRTIADEHAGEFRSEGFVRFFAMLSKELDDRYFETVEGHLKELKFKRGALMSSELGRGNKGTRYVLRTQPEEGRWRWMSRLSRSSYSFQIPDRDENGFRALSDLRGRGINLVANALAQSTDHILSFFRMLQAELAFYVGCLNLHERLTEKREPTCFPVPLAASRGALSARGLYDVCLTLNMEDPVVVNELNADGKSLVMITGANQGGKSTFLRGVGLAQLMMQCRMFVPAESFRASLCDGSSRTTSGRKTPP